MSVHSAEIEARKSAGNARFSEGYYREALEEYQSALELLRDGDPMPSVIWSNMAASHLKLREAAECEKYSRLAVQADPKSVKAWVRLVRALAGAGNISAALQVLLADAAQAIPPNTSEELHTQLEGAQMQLKLADEAFEVGETEAALEKFRELEKGILFDAPELIARMGHCYLKLGALSRVLNVSTALLRRDSGNVSGYLLRAEAQFESITEHFDSEAWDKAAESAMKNARQALSFDPEHRGAAATRRRLRGHIDLVREVRSAIAQGRHEHAEELLTKVLDIGPSGRAPMCRAGGFAARCHAERGRLRLERHDAEGCIVDCMAASRLDHRLVIAPVLEAQALQQLERWDAAVTVLEALYEWNKDNDTFWKVEWAKFEVRRVRRPDYYKILGLSPDCTQVDVKKNYLKKSVECHPDKKVAKGGNDIQEEFTMVVEAYEFLGNEAKRELYDKGYDAQGIREVLAVRKRFGGQAPCVVCGEDESGKLGADNRWYCVRCWDSYYREADYNNVEQSASKKKPDVVGEESVFKGPPMSGQTDFKPHDIEKNGVGTAHIEWSFSSVNPWEKPLASVKPELQVQEKLGSTSDSIVYECID